MSKLIKEVLSNKAARDEVSLNSFAAQLSDVGDPWFNE